MLITSFTFNKNTSSSAVGDKEMDLMFVRTMANYINDLLKVKGYLYLNQIYEIFHIRWNVDRDNPCVVYDKNRLVEIVTNEIEDGFFITINY